MRELGTNPSLAAFLTEMNQAVKKGRPSELAFNTQTASFPWSEVSGATVASLQEGNIPERASNIQSIDQAKTTSRWTGTALRLGTDYYDCADYPKLTSLQERRSQTATSGAHFVNLIALRYPPEIGDTAPDPRDCVGSQLVNTLTVC